MNADPAFEALIRSLVPTLQESGFRKKGRTFHARRAGAWAVLAFQKSQKSSASKVFFTINLGIALDTILKFDCADTEAPPSLERCHWSTRIGFLLPKREDTWWVIESESDLGRLRGEIEPTLRDMALPKLQSLASDAALCECWLRGEADGLTEIQRLRTLSIVLRAQGKTEALRETVRSMLELSNGRPTEGLVRGHLQRLGTLEAS